MEIQINFQSSSIRQLLSERQNQVLELKLQNASESDIANELQISRKTVHTHYRRVIVKIYRYHFKNIHALHFKLNKNK